MEHEISFTQALDFQGIDEDSECEIDYSIEDFSLVLRKTVMGNLGF